MPLLNSNSGWYSTAYQMLNANDGFAWVVPWIQCGRGGWCVNTDQLSRMVSTNGSGVCAVKVGTKWYGGRYVGQTESCNIPSGTSYGQPGTEAVYRWRNLAQVKVLIK
jgi:hypothetical protein